MHDLLQTPEVVHWGAPVVAEPESVPLAGLEPSEVPAPVDETLPPPLW
jgi:hypothetical protein